MPTLGQIIREIQHDAAALPTDALRDEIEISLDVQDAAINLYYSIPPGGRTVEDLIIATARGHGLGPDDRPVRPGTDYPARGHQRGRHHHPELARRTPRPGGVLVPLARLGLRQSPLSRKQPV